MKTLLKLKSDLLEKHLTPAEKTKREEIAQAIHRSNPDMPMAKKMAIATAQAKKVAEGTVTEKFWDNEGEMIKSQLKAIVDKSNSIISRLNDMSELEAWVQSSVSDANYAIGCVYDHIMYSEDAVKEENNQHFCASHVYSNMYGEGVVVEGAHAEPDENGNIEWYLVEFNDSVKKVYTDKLEIMIAEYHDNHKKKKKKAVNG